MKIQLRKFITKNNYSDNVAYKIINTDSCCNKIFANSLINFTTDEDSDKPIVAMIESEEVPDTYDDITYTEYTQYPISYCPYCGEKIEIEIVEIIDVTAVANQLHKEINDIYKQLNNRNSKKMIKELQNQRDELHRELEYYTMNDGFDRGDSMYCRTARYDGKENEDE